MIERLSTRANANGCTYQAEVDHDLHTVDFGYFVFRRDSDAITATKSDINRYIIKLINNGYTKI